MNAGNSIPGDFEQLLAELQQQVALLEGTDLTLQQSVDAYERCVALANACTALLDAATLRVSQIKIETPRLRETSALYDIDSRRTRTLLLGEDDELADLLDHEDEDEDE